MDKTSPLKANITYDENGRELDKIITDIYLHVLLPKSKTILDTERNNDKKTRDK